MKRRLIIPFCLLFMMFIADIQGQKGITIRPYARIGFTLLYPSLEDLDYTGDWTDATVDKGAASLGIGAQVQLQKNNVGLGADFGFSTLFNNEVTYVVPGTGASYYTDKEYTIYLIFFGEYRFGRIFFVQGGLGPHITPWYYEYYYDSFNYSDDEEWYSGVQFNFALMASAGAEIPVTPNVNLLLMGKFDAIMRYGITIPFTVNAGLSFTF